jgi:hypothetical protein
MQFAHSKSTSLSVNLIQPRRSTRKLTIPRHILLGRIHAKRQRTKRRKIPGPRRRRKTQLRVVYQQRIFIRQKRLLPRRRVLGIPHDLGLLGRHVDRNGVRGLVRGARHHDVDGGGRDGHGCVVPREGDVVAHFVQLVALHDVGGYHCEAPSGQARVEGCGLGFAGYLGARGFCGARGLVGLGGFVVFVVVAALGSGGLVGGGCLGGLGGL